MTVGSTISRMPARRRDSRVITPRAVHDSKTSNERPATGISHVRHTLATFPASEPYMRSNLADLLGSDTRAADVCVNANSWRVHIFGIAVIGPHAFLPVALVAPTHPTPTAPLPPPPPPPPT